MLFDKLSQQETATAVVSQVIKFLKEGKGTDLLKDSACVRMVLQAIHDTDQRRHHWAQKVVEAAPEKLRPQVLSFLIPITCHQVS